MQYILATKKHLKASTAQGLEREMLRNNVKRNMFFDYQIVHDGTSWFAWYLDDKNDPMKAAKELNNATKS